MAVNKYRPHLFLLPEDDADRQIANGFLLHPDLLVNQVRVLEEAGGWLVVLEKFSVEYAPTMDVYPHRFMVLVIVFDGKDNRLSEAEARIPEHLKDRVFILGVATEPERLKPDLGSFEQIGIALSKDCREDTSAAWGHPLLKHNEAELKRFRHSVGSLLFGIPTGG